MIFTDVIMSISLFPQNANISETTELLDKVENNIFGGFELDVHNMNEDRARIYEDLIKSYEQLKHELKIS
jgi:hypothetical protein